MYKTMRENCADYILSMLFTSVGRPYMNSMQTPQMSRNRPIELTMSEQSIYLTPNQFALSPAKALRMIDIHCTSVPKVGATLPVARPRLNHEINTLKSLGVRLARALPSS